MRAGGIQPVLFLQSECLDLKYWQRYKFTIISSSNSPFLADRLKVFRRKGRYEHPPPQRACHHQGRLLCSKSAGCSGFALQAVSRTPLTASKGWQWMLPAEK
jgi:hypothetical protein